MKKKNFIIVGAGDLSREITNLLHRLYKGNFTAVYFVDAQPDVSRVSGNVINGDWNKLVREYSCADWKVILGFLNPVHRGRIFKKFKQEEYCFASLIATGVTNYAKAVGEGTVIFENTFIGLDAVIGDNCMIYNNCTVSHDVTLGSHCSLGPGTAIAGRAVVEESVQFGIGSSVLPKIHIGARARVGAGSTVTKNVQLESTVIGVPARNMHQA